MSELELNPFDSSVQLRLIKREDNSDLRDVYVDSIQSQAPSFYNNSQIEAWAALANLPSFFERAFDEGRGWALLKSCLL